jgi:hypothetical protein
MLYLVCSDLVASIKLRRLARDKHYLFASSLVTKKLNKIDYLSQSCITFYPVLLKW